MTGISNLEASILGLICERSQYGYELEKTIEQRHMRMWTDVAYSSIYYVLKKLESKGYVTSKKEIVENRPIRKVFSVTPEGRVVMKEKIMEVLVEFEKHVFAIDLGLMNLDLLTLDEVLDCLDKYESDIDQTLEFLECVGEEVAANDGPPNIRALVRKPTYHVNAEREWLKEFRQEITDHYRKKDNNSKEEM